MPIYEYKCETCGYPFEKLVYTSEKENIECPKCSSKKVKRLLSSTCIINSSGGSSCATSSPGGFS